MWINIKDQVPPHDKLVLVRGTKKWTNKTEVYNYKVYAIAFNYDSPPNMSMLQVVYQEESNATYMKIPFEIEEWMILE